MPQDRGRLGRRLCRKRVDHAGELMKTEYDPQRDVAYFQFSSSHSVRQVELSDLRIVDYGADGTVVGVEFISPSRGIDLTNVPRAAAIEREARRLGLPVRGGATVRG